MGYTSTAGPAPQALSELSEGHGGSWGVMGAPEEVAGLASCPVHALRLQPLGTTLGRFSPAPGLRGLQSTGSSPCRLHLLNLNWSHGLQQIQSHRTHYVFFPFLLFARKQKTNSNQDSITT